MATSHIVQISSKSFIWVAPLISSIVVPHFGQQRPDLGVDLGDIIRGRCVSLAPHRDGTASIPV
jgi:hypothetical protein